MQLSLTGFWQELHESPPSSVSCHENSHSIVAASNIVLGTGHCFCVCVWGGGFGMLLNSMFFCMNGMWNVVSLESVG